MDANESIRIANAEVSIIKACNLVGLDVGDFAVASIRVYCPFGQLYHEDGGNSKAMRIYPGTNSAYCFAGCGYFSPVKLIAMDRDMSDAEAAEFLLGEINFVPPDWEARWEDLKTRPLDVSTPDLAEALKVACARLSPDWERLQFEEEVGEMFNRCLSLLWKVRTDEDATMWLTKTKLAMKRVLST